MHPKHLSSYCTSKMALWLELVPTSKPWASASPVGVAMLTRGQSTPYSIYLFTALLVTLRLRPTP